MLRQPHPIYNLLTAALCASALLGQAQPTAADRDDPSYRLGPDDRITITALHADEISGKPIQVDGTGSINLPMVGRVKVGGLTVPEAETAIATSLKVYIEKPLVTVNVTEYQSQPVSVMGEVTTPGQYQVKGQKTILEMLSMAGGLRPDSGHVLRITRRLENGRLPLAGASDAPSGQFTVAELKLKDLMEARNPADNIFVQAHDVITVPKAELIYVVGEVNKAGGFVLNDQENLSALQALALAGGITKSASLSHARILCASDGPTGARKETEVDLRKILEGKSPDVAIHAQDILFIPTNTARSVGLKALEMAIQTASGVVIWRSAHY
jgi:polysaccharide biosynthesis/export protein